MRISATGRFNSRTGFTLMEILVVLVILSLTLGMTLSGLDSGFGQDDRKMNIRFLQGLLSQIRNKAIVSQQVQNLYLEMDGVGPGRYWVQSGQEEDGKKINKKKLFKGTTALYGLQKSNGTLQTTGRFKITFLPQGLAEECTLYLRGDEQYLAVTLQAVSPRLVTRTTTSPGSRQ